MPTYDYVCEACGHAFEQWQSFRDEALTKCPACNEKKLRRLFGTGAAVLFKGTGFYETDYKRDDSYKAAAKADAGPPEAPKADEKPAAKSPGQAAKSPGQKKGSAGGAGADSSGS